MKNPDRIYTFFVALALGFWNPATFYLFYHAKPAYQVTSVHLLVWTVFLVGIFAARDISRGRFSDTARNTALTLAFTGLLFGFLFLVNAGIGRVKRAKSRATTVVTPEDDRKGGLVFEPNSKAVYHTDEFNFEANINSLGLRDREINKEKGSKYRILCFGDSWTFGWGVSVENSWPRKLEEALQRAGRTDIEVINCGRGGQYTTTYKMYMAEAVPLLKPDLVLVGVLQEDDLAQLYELNYKIRDKETVGGTAPAPAFSSFLQGSFGNILLLFARQKNGDEPIEIREIWKGLAKSFYDGLDRIHRLRFKTLDDSMQRMFFSGNLNPGLVDAYVKFPDRVTVFNNPSNPATQFALSEMAKDIADMKTVCQKQGATLVFANMPINFFNGHEVVRSPSDVLNPFFEANNHIDSMYRSIAAGANIPYVQLTEHFRNLPEKHGYYFKYDGHPNERGYAEIANYLAQQLTEHNYYKTN